MSIHLRQICLVAEELAPVVEDISAVFGLRICYRDEGVARFGLENALFPIGANFLEIVSPIRDGTAAGRYLRRRGGDGGYMVIMQAGSKNIQDAAIERAKRLGIRIAWQREHRTGNFLQFHPVDTGGAFFELDRDIQNNPQGNWEPAGGTGWENKMNREIISDLKAVELQSDYPAALAERWAKLAGLPLSRDDEGRSFMALENAIVRFVPATDGRGDGLGALEVTGIRPEKALSAARQRKLPVQGNRITLCGVRFTVA